MPEKQFNKIIRHDGRFCSKEMENRYLEQDWIHYSRRVRIIFILTGIAYLGGILGDHLILGTDIRFYLLLVLRMITFLSAMSSILFTVQNRGYKRIQKVIFAYYLVICLSECMELCFKPELGGDSIPFLLFINISYFIFFNAQLPYLLLAGLFGPAAYGFVLVTLNKETPGHAIPVLLTFLLVTFLSLYYTMNINRSKRIEFFTANELRKSNHRLQKEIDSRKKAEEKLKTLSFTDALTGLYNRRHFTNLTKKEICRADRSGRELSLLFLDVDHFKKVNDNHGHDCGDIVLQELAAILKSTIRELDIPSRYGGEEFTVLLPETSGESAMILAERLRLTIERRIITCKRVSLSITVSIGISVLNKDEDLDMLLKNADLALYEAKGNGRNRSILYSPEV